MKSIERLIQQVNDVNKKRMSSRNNLSLPPDERDDFKCPVCWEFACEPLCLKPCNHFICKHCLQNLKECNSPNNCPVCRGNIAKTVPDKDLELKMAQLEEKCPGCQELVALSMMKQHVMNCPTLLRLGKYSNQSTRRMFPPWKPAPQNGSRYNKPRGFQAPKHWRETQFDEQESDEEIAPMQRRSIQHHRNDEENFGGFSRQDHQHHRYFKPQRPPSGSEENDGDQRPQFYGRGRGRGSRNRNGRYGRQSHCHPMRRKDRHQWTPEPFRAEGSDDGNEAAGGASQMMGMGHFDPSKGARPKYLPNKISYRRMPPPVILPTAPVMDASSASENASAASRMPPPRILRTAPVVDASPASENTSAASSIQGDSTKYTCPYCGEPGLPQLGLVNHCLGQHSSDKRRVVCPVCASMPWGNPNQLSTYFIEHLRKRHSFDYKTYIPNEDDDEEAMLSMALEASLKEI